MFYQRKNLLLIFIFNICFALCFLKSVAQKQWTIDECIQYALQHNLSIKQQQFQMDIAGINLTQSKAMLFPSVNANASNVYNYGRTIDRFTNQFALDMVRSNNFYISANLTLFNGFQLLNGVRKNMYDLRASRYDLDAIRNDIALHIATAYLQVLYFQETYQHAEKQLDVTLLQLERTRILVEAGAIANNNLLTIQAQSAIEEYQKVSAHTNLEMAYLQLTQLMDLPSHHDFAIVTPDIDIESVASPLTSDYIYNIAVQNMPEMKSAEMKLESSKKTVQIARGAVSPSISLGTAIGSGYSGASRELTNVEFVGLDTIGVTSGSPQQAVLSPVFDYIYSPVSFNKQIDQNYNRSIGLYVSIPLFNNLVTSSNINRSKISMQMAETSVEQTKQHIRKIINQAHLDAVSALHKYISAKKQVTATEYLFISAEHRFNVGEIESIEYQDAKNKYIIAQSELLHAKYEYIFKMKIMDFYMGKPLDF